MKKIKFTAELKSRVLSEHADNNMKAGGGSTIHQAYCINQVALNSTEAGYGGAYQADSNLADTFDEYYDSEWTPEQMLEFIETRGKNVARE